VNLHRSSITGFSTAGLIYSLSLSLVAGEEGEALIMAEMIMKLDGTLNLVVHCRSDCANNSLDLLMGKNKMSKLAGSPESQNKLQVKCELVHK
jgi:hypothetical protein